jgi:hypothetical protein
MNIRVLQKRRITKLITIRVLLNALFLISFVNFSLELNDNNGLCCGIETEDSGRGMIHVKLCIRYMHMYVVCTHISCTNKAYTIMEIVKDAFAKIF